MKKRTKRNISILLSVAMVLSMNTFAFAEEVTDENVAIENISETAEQVLEDVSETAGDAVEVISETTGDVVGELDSVLDTENTENNANNNSGEISIQSFQTTADDTSTPISISADTTLSDNLANIKNYLSMGTALTVSSGGITYAIQYPKAIVYNGEKIGSKKYVVPVKVYTHQGNVSINDIMTLSDNKLLTDNGWKEEKIKNAKIKAAKTATVLLNGKASVEIKNGTYIKSIKLDNKNTNKIFNGLFKDAFKATKKSTAKMDVNGYDNGNGKPVPFGIAVYPAYAGNDKDAVQAAKTAGLKTVTLDFTKVKYKDGLPKKISGTIDSKKVKLSHTTKPGKYKGFGDSKTTTEDTNSLKAKTYVEADGCFGGNIYFTAK